MRVQRHIVLAGSAVLLIGCSTDTTGDGSRGDGAPMSMTPGMTQKPAMGAAGTAGSDFGNSMQTPQGAGGVPSMVMQMPAASACKGGLYLGTYNCDVDIGGFASPLEGDVSFALEIDETVVAGDCENDEFCADLVIAEGSGTLFGLAGLTGFEAQLEGGLDCQTGEFRASAPNGIYGIPDSTDPNDPNSPLTVADPPFGTFTGSLTGMHTTSPAERIAGDWDLADSASGTRCAGPFTVELQP